MGNPGSEPGAVDHEPRNSRFGPGSAISAIEVLLGIARVGRGIKG